MTTYRMYDYLLGGKDNFEQRDSMIVAAVGRRP
jgi:hypothetical protein